MNRPTIVCLVVLAAACSDSTATPEQIPVPELETIPYSLLGTGKIAFERIAENYHGVYLIDPVAQTTTVIGSGDFNGPALSPSGGELGISVYSPGTGSADIFAHNTDGSGNRQVSGYPGDEGVPTWTPDGLALTFLRGQPGTPVRAIVKVHATSGSTLETITLNRADACSVFYVGDVEDRVEVSATGLIATPCNLTALAILNEAGVRIGNFQSQASLITGFAWSPDGSKLAVVELTGGPGNVPVSQTLRILSPDGVSQRVVFTAPLSVAQNGRYPGAMDTGLCWLKGVDRLLVPILNEGRRYSQLWVVNEDGTGLTKITTAAGVTDRSVTCSR